MQWLQVTFATRFNRMRKENGHLFQGRYRAIVLQNEGVWARVTELLARDGFTTEEVENSRNSVQWKVSLACRLQLELGCLWFG